MGRGLARTCSITRNARRCQTRSDVPEAADRATKAHRKATATHEEAPVFRCESFSSSRAALASAVVIYETRRKAVTPKRSIKRANSPFTAERKAP